MPTDAENQANEQTPNKPEFNEVQQARIAEIIKETQGRAAREVREQLAAATAKAAALEADLQAARSERAAKKAKDEQPDFEAELNEMRRVKALNEAELERARKVALDKDKEIAQAKNEAKQVLKKVAMQDAANQVQFFDKSAVIKNIQDDVAFDEAHGRWIVKGEDGSTRLNNKYEPMTLDEYVKEYAAKNPYTVRGDVKQGTGAAPNTSRFDVTTDGKMELKNLFGPGSSAKLANDLAKRDPAAYKAMRASAKAAGLVS